MLVGLFLSSACDGEGADRPFIPTFDGPFEVEVRVAAGIDASKVRCGLFRATPASAEVVRDGETSEALAEFYIFQDSGIVVMAPGYTEFDRASFTPVLEYDCNVDGIMQVQLPTSYELADAFIPVAWYDANEDGRLDIANNGMTEFGRAPGRDAPELPADRGFLATIFPTTNRSDAQGVWEARVLSSGENEDGVFVAASATVLADELTGWSLSIDETTTEARSFGE